READPRRVRRRSDNLPARRDGQPPPRGTHGEMPAAPPRAAAQRTQQTAASLPNTASLTDRPPSSIVPSSGPGLRLSWIVYRGAAAAVTFSPDQMKTWTDTRAYANSPWSPPFTIPMPPPGGKWVAEATFREAGTYVLRSSRQRRRAV